MRLIPTLLIPLSLGMFSLAFGAETPAPATPTTPTTSHATTPTIAPSSSSVAAPATTSASLGEAKTETIAAAASEANVKRLRAAGYKPETHNGETFYCRRETKMGSRFDTKVCGTAAQLAAATLNGQEMAEISRRQALTTPTGR